MVNDKNIDNILALLPNNAIYYFCKADIERGFHENLLKKKCKKFQLFGNCYQSVISAFKSAKKVKGLVVEGGAKYSRKIIEELIDHVKKYKAKGLAWDEIRVDTDLAQREAMLARSGNF